MQKIKPFCIKIKPWPRSGRKFWGFTRGKQQKVHIFQAEFCIKIRPEVKIIKPEAQNILKNAKIKTMVKIIKPFGP